MPRVARTLTIAPGLPHHVILRGNNRRRLFSYPRCYRAFLRLLRAAGERHAVLVHAVALMSNHVHLVVTPDDALTLARFVKSVAQPYAWHRNAARHGSGKLFEQRYVALPIRDAAHLAATLAYVDLNPERAGLVARAEAYPWSTCALHAGGEAREEVRAVWSPHDWYVGLAEDAGRRASLYREWLVSREPSGLDAIAEETRDCDGDVPAPRPRVRRPDGTRAA